MNIDLSGGAVSALVSDVAVLEQGFNVSEPTFCNPILPAPSADPWAVYHEGFYYYCESRHEKTICIRKASIIALFNDDPGTEVWTAPVSGPNSQHVWAPELHFLDGKWYIYYAADDGENKNHRMWVLESEGTDPLGGYRCRGQLDTGAWAIDGTVLTLDDGRRYFIWSGWEGDNDGQQNLYIAPMRSPWELSEPRRLIASPEMRWECMEMPICEGPQVLRRNGKVFLVYSASGSWSEHYCLGMLTLEGSDPLVAAHWKKTGPVFRKTKRVWGVGHCSFVKSASGQDWILFHAKTKKKKGWADRTVYAQKFGWTADGCPDFGSPSPAGTRMPLPE